MDHKYDIYALDDWVKDGRSYAKRLMYEDIPSWETAVRMISRFEKLRPGKIFVMESAKS